jgi:hypothetical protein
MCLRRQGSLATAAMLTAFAFAVFLAGCTDAPFEPVADPVPSVPSNQTVQLIRVEGGQRAVLGTTEIDARD